MPHRSTVIGDKSGESIILEPPVLDITVGCDPTVRSASAISMNRSLSNDLR